MVLQTIINPSKKLVFSRKNNREKIKVYKRNIDAGNRNTN